MVRYVRGLATSAAARGLPDAELLERYVRLADDDAFAELLRRYAPMVWSVCRQLLSDAQDAEDAFQATFLLLARRAASVRSREAVAGWLQGAAHRCALQLRRKDARRRTREGKAAMNRRPTTAGSDLACRELLAILHEEARRLPAGQREAFALCGLGGLPVREAAARLGRPEGTVSWWLAEARGRLRGRLARRGFGLPAVLGLLVLAREEQAAVRPALVCATARAALALARSGAVSGGGVSGKVLTLAQEVSRSMCSSKSKVLAICLLAASLVSGAGGLAFRSGTIAEARAAEDGPVPAARPAPAPQAASGAFGGTVADATTDKVVKGVAVLVRRFAGGKRADEIKLVSDAAGHFRFDLPADWSKSADAKVAVSVEAPPGYAGFPYRTQLGTQTDTGVTLDELRREKALGVPSYFDRILMFPTKPVKGRVLDPDGKPAAGMDVVVCSVHLKDKAVGPHRLVRRTKTDAGGRFDGEVLSPGPVVLYLLPERYAARYVKLNDPEGDLGDYKLEAGIEVAGKLRDLRNDPLPGCWVRVGTSPGLDADRDLWTVGMGGFARWCRTGPDGTFRTAPLPAGEYQASAHGVKRKGESLSTPYGWRQDPSWDGLADRERVGEPLEVCIVPQAVSVRPGEIPQVVLRAVPHVNIEIRVADRDGNPQECIVPFRYTFDSKEYWDSHGNLDTPTTREGRLVIRVPHGASRLDGSVMARGAICLCQNSKGAKDNQFANGPMFAFFKGIDEDKNLDILWIREADASLKVSAKDGSPLPDVEIDLRHSGHESGGAAPMGSEMYRLWSVQPGRPLNIRVEAAGYETVTKTVTAPAGAATRIEITMEKKK